MPIATGRFLTSAGLIATLTLTSSPNIAFAAAPATSDDAAPALDDAQQSQFDGLLAEAAEKFDAGDFDGAIASFEAAYEIQADASLLYNIGRVYEEKGDLEPAVDYYKDFVRQPGIALELRQQANERIKVLEDILETTREEEEPEPAVAPEPEPQPEPQLAADTEPGEDGRGLRIAGYSLLGVGGALLIGGGVAGGLANADANDLEDETDPGQRQDLKDSGETKALTADILFIAGGAIALTGIALTVAGFVKKKRSSNVAVAPVLSPSYGGATLRMSF